MKKSIYLLGSFLFWNIFLIQAQEAFPTKNAEWKVRCNAS